MGAIRRLIDSFYSVKISLQILLNKGEKRKEQGIFGDKLIRKQIRYVYKNSKYYRNKLRSLNLDPFSIKGYRDLVKIPILSKEEVIESYSDIIIDKNVNHEIKTTSGSSGLKLPVMRTSYESAIRRALLVRSFYAAGMDTFDRLLIYYNLKMKKHWFFLHFFQHDYGRPKQAMDFIRKNRINCILSAPSMLEILGEEYSRQERPHDFKVIISLAELLPDKRRKRIEDLFNTPVYNHYSLKELPEIAFECKKGSMHINSDVLALEIIKDGRQVYGELGEIIVTDLFNKWAPLIRYNTGDIGSLSTDACSCGLKFPMLKKLIGRANDFFVRYDGGKISPQQIMHAMYSVGSVKQYQVVQKSVKKIVLKIVPLENFSVRDAAILREKIEGLLPHTQTKIVKVRNISPYGDAGKIRFIVSKVR